jgi:hypothetical protein
MRVLGKGQITNASLTVTNLESTEFSEKLKTFQLSDNIRSLTNSTSITMDFAGSQEDVNCVAICGTNLTSSAVVTLSYSNSNIESPEAVISLPLFSNFNQVFFLSTAITRRYWRITISDSTLSEVWAGHLYIGEYYQVPGVEFPHGSSLNVVSNQLVNTTGQEYGSKFYTPYSCEWNFTGLDETDVAEVLSIVRERMNIEPVLMVEYEGSYDKEIYRPKYMVLDSDEYPYPMVNDPLSYNLLVTGAERF